MVVKPDESSARINGAQCDSVFFLHHQPLCKQNEQIERRMAVKSPDVAESESKQLAFTFLCNYNGKRASPKRARIKVELKGIIFRSREQFQ